MKRLFIGLSFIALFYQYSFAQTTWQVGPTRTYTKPSEVMALVQDGDIVEIDAGEYIGDVGTWYANDITIVGIGGKAHLRAGGQDSQGKAIWVIVGDNYALKDIEFSECTVPDKNGAGIRHEGTDLIISHCYFHDNETGVLTTNNEQSTVIISNSEFARNSHPNGNAHNVYINKIKTFFMTKNYFHGAIEGHNVKSRAARNLISYNRIMDEKDGAASYQIDLPNGGNAVIIGNIIQQGKKAPNFHILSYAAEVNTSNKYDSNILSIQSNTIVNELGNGFFFKVFNNISSNVEIFNNLLVGKSDIYAGPNSAALINNLYFETIEAAGLVDLVNYNYQLTANSPAIDAGLTSSEIPLPNLHYVHPADATPRPVIGTLDVGAYEFGEGTSTSLNPTIIIDGAQELCVGESTVLQLDKAYATYLWSTGATDPSILVETAGVYSVTVTDGQNQSGEAQIEILNKSNCPISEKPDWEIVSTETGTNHTIITPSNIASNINGKQLKTGDWIGFFFDDDGVEECAGFGQWDAGNNTSFPVYGDDITTPEKEGFSVDEIFKIKVWLVETGTAYTVAYKFAATDEIITHTDAFADNGISRLVSVELEEDNSMELNPTIEVIGATSLCPNETTMLRVVSSFTTYEWSNGATTSSITVTNPDTYSVTVSDAVGNTGMDELTILAKENCDNPENEINGDTVVFNLQPIESRGEERVLIPITVENFKNIGGFQYAIQLDDTQGQLQFEALEEADLMGIIYEISEDGQVITLAWFDENPISLADESIVFYLAVNIDAVIEEDCYNTSLNVENIGVEVVAYQEGISILVPHRINTATICPLSTFSVNGLVYMENGNPVTNVLIDLNGSNSTKTNSVGTYILNNLAAEEKNVIVPSKDGVALEGVSTADLVLIMQHVVGKKRLNSPYKMIAADVNQSKSISILDVTILSSLLIDNIQSLPNGHTWRFIPENYEFQNPQNPFIEDYPEYLNLDQETKTVEDANFIGIKLGDVNETSMGRRQAAVGELLLMGQRQKTINTNEYLLTVTAENFEEILGLQMEINFAPTDVQVLEVIPAELAKMGQFKMNEKLLARGRLPIVWYHTTAMDLEKDAVLFTIRYQQKNDNLALPFKLSTEQLEAEAATINFEKLNIELYTNTEQKQEAFSALVAPNPFKDLLQLNLEIPQDGIVGLTIQDVNGRVIINTQKQFGVGSQTWYLEENWFSTSGLYFISVTTSKETVQLKVLKF